MLISNEHFILTKQNKKKIMKNKDFSCIQTILRDFKNAPFYNLCLFHMIDLRMFFFIMFYPLAKRTMICHDFDLLMLFILM